jgi:diadenylate cyclase
MPNWRVFLYANLVCIQIIAQHWAAVRAIIIREFIKMEVACMSFNWSDLLTWGNFVNVLDILVVWYFVYKLIMLVRGTKAVQLLKGIVVIVVIKLISWGIGLRTVSYIMDQVINWGVIAIVIIFQPEIRRGLEHLGRGSIFTRNRNQNEKENQMIAALDKAIQYMSKRRIGALITIQMNTGLEDYIETGIDLNADVTGELLINIFIPNTPLHDGAVIIQDGKIAVAAAYLPLSESNLIPKEYGTRHRAAVGISEVTDALTIVVSEETGGVMITRNSEMLQELTQEDYLKYLRRALVQPETPQRNGIQEFIDGIIKGGTRK